MVMFHMQYFFSWIGTTIFDLTLYFDISAAVHRRAGLGRYAESLAGALLAHLVIPPNQPTLLNQPTNLPTYPSRNLAFFYNREAASSR